MFSVVFWGFDFICIYSVVGVGASRFNLVRFVVII